MSGTTTHQVPPHDDLDAYLDTLSEDERHNVAHAEAALDLALLLYEVRAARGITQTTAAAISGVKQQAISRWEHAHPNIQVASLRRYLAALGYNLGIVVSDTETSRVVATAGLPPYAEEAIAASASSSPDVSAASGRVERVDETMAQSRA